MTFTSLTYLTIIVAFVSLLIGLTLFSLSSRKGYERSHTTLVTSWPFLATSIAMFMFLLFPGSTSSGTFFGISLTGAVALFILIWYFGAKLSREALNLDDSTQKLKEEKQKLEDDLRELRNQKTQAPKAIELHYGIPYVFQLKGKQGKKIALITGRIEGVKIADVWVSSENTDMQMARFYDRSISGVVRYCGAKKAPSGHVIDDIIAKELKSLVGSNLPVAPGTVYVTGSGELQNDNRVKKIFHVASVHGEVGIGYIPVENIQFCVTKALREADSEKWKSVGLKTILFPLLGTGTARGKVDDLAKKLIQAAASYFETTENSAIEYIYFLARTDVERDICHTVFKELERLGRLVEIGSTKPIA